MAYIQHITSQYKTFKKKGEDPIESIIESVSSKPASVHSTNVFILFIIYNFLSSIFDHHFLLTEPYKQPSILIEKSQTSRSSTCDPFHDGRHSLNSNNTDRLSLSLNAEEIAEMDDQLQGIAITPRTTASSSARMSRVCI